MITSKYMNKKGLIVLGTALTLFGAALVYVSASSHLDEAPQSTYVWQRNYQTGNYENHWNPERGMMSRSERDARHLAFMYGVGALVLGASCFVWGFLSGLPN